MRKCSLFGANEVSSLYWSPFHANDHECVFSCNEQQKVYSKRAFCAMEVDFFGYSVSAAGVRPLESNVKATLDLPEPQNTK